MQNNKALSLPATILGVAIIISSLIGAWSFFSVRSLDNTMVVTGSAKQSVTADNVRWIINVNRVVDPRDVSDAYTDVSNDVSKVKSFLSKNGIKAEEVKIGRASCRERVYVLV